jgi:hypothetical protein
VVSSAQSAAVKVGTRNAARMTDTSHLICCCEHEPTPIYISSKHHNTAPAVALLPRPTHGRTYTKILESIVVRSSAPIQQKLQQQQQQQQQRQPQHAVGSGILSSPNDFRFRARNIGETTRTLSAFLSLVAVFSRRALVSYTFFKSEVCLLRPFLERRGLKHT